MMMKEVKTLNDLPAKFHIALQIVTLNKNNKNEILKEIFHTLRWLYGFSHTDEMFIEEFKVIRKETFFEDGWSK